MECMCPRNRMKTKLHLVFSITIFFTCFSVVSQQSYWKKTESRVRQFGLNTKTNSTIYQLDLKQLQKEFAKTQKGLSIHLPNSNQQFTTYYLEETPVLHPDLAAKYPNIHSFTGWSKDKKEKVRISMSSKGIQVMRKDMATGKTSFIEPVKKSKDRYVVFNKGNKEHSFYCKTEHQSDKEIVSNNYASAKISR